MKKTRILSLFLALALLIGIAIPLSAANGTTINDGSITIKAPDRLQLDKADFKAYKLFDLARFGDSYSYLPSATSGTPDNLDAIRGFLTWAATGSNTSLGAGYTAGLAGEDYTRFGINAPVMAFLDTIAVFPTHAAQIIQLARDIDNYNASSPANPILVIDGASAGATLDSNGSVVFSPLVSGYYLVTGKGLPIPTLNDGNNVHDAEKVTSLGILCTVDASDDGKDFEIDLKADAPTLEKKVDDSHNGTGHGWEDVTEVNIGDTVNFRLKSQVPVTRFWDDEEGEWYPDSWYTSYTYKIYDQMSKGLTLLDNLPTSNLLPTDPTTLVPTVQFVDPLGVGTTYTLTRTGGSPDFTITKPAPAPYGTLSGLYTGGSSFQLEIHNIDRDAWADYQGWDIVVTYSARLNDQAVMAPTSNPNRAKLEYSNNPNNTETGETPWDEVDVYTFELVIVKTNGDEGQTPPFLAGAEFQLYRCTDPLTGAFAAGTQIQFVQESTNPNVYHVATPEELANAGVTKTTTLVSSAGSPITGVIRVKGLDQGVYVLKETKAPVGIGTQPDFNGLIYDIVITITHEDADAHAGSGSATYKWNTTAGLPASRPDTPFLCPAPSAPPVPSVAPGLEVENRSGDKLPETGGIGTTIFYIAGGILVVLLAVAFIAMRKRNILGSK